MFPESIPEDKKITINMQDHIIFATQAVYYNNSDAIDYVELYMLDCHQTFKDKNRILPDREYITKQDNLYWYKVEEWVPAPLGQPFSFSTIEVIVKEDTDNKLVHVGKNGTLGVSIKTSANKFYSYNKKEGFKRVAKLKVGKLLSLKPDKSDAQHIVNILDTIQCSN